MVHRSPTRILIPALLAFLTALPADPQGTCLPAAELAERILAGRSGWGDLELEGRYSLDEDLLAAGRMVAAVEAVLGREALGALRGLGSATLCAALVLDVDGELVARQERRLDTGDLRGAEAWRYGLSAELPEGTGEILLVVQEPASGLWGAAVADDAGGPLPPPGPQAVHLAGGEAWTEVVRPEPASREAAAPAVIRLVPPRRPTVSGGTRFDVLVSTDAVDRVAFRLDGRPVDERRRRPFAARIPLDDPPRVQVVEAVAFDAAGREMGRDTLEVNRVDRPFRVRITELHGDPASGSMEIAAEVTVPAEGELDRLELYRNQDLVARFDGSFRYRLAVGDAGPEDYLRVAAFLTDGSSIDDVALLATPGAIERVEVNLVELQVVATDGRGQPAADLAAGDFTIFYRGKPQPPQSFAYADDVPLLLGVVIDTSGSMELVMHDTRKAAAKFLGTTVLPQDRAFLVDFDKQPRLLHPTTDDLPALLLDLAKLQAGGSTALYDAIVFSMLQFERVRGRKALVILTDGDDYESRFGPRYCADVGQRAGVPIYIIGLGELDVLRRAYSKADLRKVTSETGGRFYLVNSLEELGAAYAQINAELRSQYSLSFYAERDLDAEERREVRVEIARPGLSARTVIGAQRSAE
jgi:VWFA-related protein